MGPIGGTVVVVVLVVVVLVVVSGGRVVVVGGGVVVVVLSVRLGKGGMFADDVATDGLLSTSSSAPGGRVGVLRLDGAKGVSAALSPPFV
jgi:hypothetical protein